MKKMLINAVIGTSLLSSVTYATQWQMIPEQSKITFVATQNNAPVTGEFTAFTGDINFDPQQLASSHIQLDIDMNSVNASYKELVNTLKTPDWFNVQLFPHAIFKAKEITAISDKVYQAKGELTLRDKTAPALVNFEVQAYSPTQFRTKGNATLKRSTFGVGQGDWSSTEEIKDDVTINFQLELKPQTK